MALNQLFQGIGAASRGGQDSPLMDTLAAMSLQDLQKYAQAHKNDAATVALISSIANIKKKAIASEQAQPVNPQQPKIGEQVIAGIAPQPAPQPMPQQALPEDQGIAQLPTDNLKGMAGGGIVAFEEGGEVPRFNGQTGSVPMSYGDQMSNLGGFLMQLPRRLVSDPSLAREKQEKENKTTAKSTSDKLNAERDAAMAQVINAGRTQPAMVNDPRLPQGYTPQTVSEQNPVTPPAVPPKPPAVLPQVKNDGAPLPGAPSVNSYANQVMGIDRLLPKKEESADRIKFMAEREDVSKPVWDKAEGMINKEKNRLSEGKEQDFYMALIEGGLAAAAGDSPNGIQNIAKGFSQGAKSYSSALKDFRKASQENSKMELDIERAKAAEKRGDMDAYQKYDDSIKNRNADIDKLRTSGLFSLQNVHTSGQYQQQAAATTAAAHLKAASMPGAQERLFATLGGGDVGKGLEKFQAAQADKTGAAYAKLYSDYAANADKSGADKMSPIEFAQNMQQFMGAMQGGGFQQKPTNDTVRTLPPVK